MDKAPAQPDPPKAEAVDVSDCGEDYLVSHGFIGIDEFEGPFEGEEDPFEDSGDPFADEESGDPFHDPDNNLEKLFHPSPKIPVTTKTKLSRQLSRQTR